MGQGKQLIIVALALSLFVTPSCFAAGTESGAKAVLAAMEQKLFFKVYNDDELENRLARIEKRVYGDATAGDFNERLERVRAVAAPQVNPDGTVSGEQTPAAPEQPQVSPEEAARAEKEAAAQRAKVAAMAAKEEEVAKLLAEGVESFRQKKASEALEKFKQVVRLDPHNAEALFNMGVAYESINKLAEASTSYRQAQEENPNNPDYQEAVSAVDKKLKGRGGVDKGPKGPLSILAEDAAAAFKRGEYFSAIDLYKQLDEQAPNQHLVKYNLGTLYFATKNYMVALEYYQAALKLKPGEPRYQKAVEQLSASLGDSHQAQRQVDQAWDKREAEEKAYAARTAGRGQQPMQQQPMQQQPMQQQPMQQPQQQAANSGKQKKQKPPKVASAPQQPAANNVLTASGAQDPMSGIGINAKSGHDGLVITNIGLASRALKVGLQQGDIIKAVDGLVVKSTGEMNQILSKKPPGASVQLIIQRAKQIGTFTL